MATNKKPRKKYKPRPILRDTMDYVRCGVSPLTDQKEADMIVRIQVRSAFEALRTGVATATDVDTLITASNFAVSLATLGKGEDWRPELRASADAIEVIQLRMLRWGKVQALAAEVAAIELMLAVHDLQLNASSVIDVERAAALTRKKVRELPGAPKRP